MSFLAPIFFVGLAAIVVPVLVHLIQRERRRVVEFPSLMFLRRIPYQSVRRRRIRNWVLLAMRAAAIALIVAAFARPFIRRGPLAAATVAGAREVVVLLDRSASMGWGDHWQRARAAARRTIDDLGGDDRATLVLFAAGAEERVRATTDRARIKAAIDAARVGSGATRYGPALKLAQSILNRSSLSRREAVLISDFQKSGWTGSEDVHFAEGSVLTPVSVASADAPNLSVPSVTFTRTTFSGQERVAVTTGIINRGAITISDMPVTLEIDGRTIETQPVGVAPNASSSVVFAPFTVGEANMKGTVRAGSDQLPQDNAFDFVLTPGRPVDVLVVDSRDGRGGRVDASFYLTKALAIGTTPAFHADVVAPGQVTPAQLDRHAVVVLNDVPFPPALTGGILTRFVEHGGDALVPGKLGPPTDPGTGSGSLGFINYSHPIFELFKAPRSGDFSAARIFRYRALDTTAPGSDARVLARFDDGAVAAAEKRVGAGRVIAWASTIDDSWNDLALRPVFLPLVHQTMRYLARYEEPAAWYSVGQALDVAPRASSRAERVALTPSGQRIALSGADAPRFIELEEQGFYEIRTKDTAKPLSVVAVNLDPAESDLSAMDPRELVAAVTGRAVSEIDQRAVAAVTPQDAERRQAIWWYLLLAGILMLAAETVVSNRLSRQGAVV